MIERCPCRAARYRGATCTNNSRLARKLIVDLTIPPGRLAHPWRVQGDITREANTPGRVPFSVSQVDRKFSLTFNSGVDLIWEDVATAPRTSESPPVGDKRS